MLIRLGIGIRLPPTGRARPYIYTILGHFLTRIVCNLVNILKRSSKDMYLLCNLNFIHIDFPNPCRAQLLLLLLSIHQPFNQ